MQALLEELRDLLEGGGDEDEITDLLGKLSKFCLQEEHIAEICKENTIITKMIHLASTQCPKDVANRSLICLGNLALFPHISHLDEREDLVEMAMCKVKELLLRDEEITDDEMDCGLSCAFILCRTVGNLESGPGVEMLESTPVVREKLYWILEQVLDAGEDGTVLGFFWDPANILQDLATLSNSDRLKPVICNFIPLVLRALKERGRGNFRLIKFASHALSQFIFEPKSHKHFVELGEEITEVLQVLINNARFKLHELEYVHVKQEIDGLIGSLQDLPGKQRSSSKPPRKHVIISYQWDNVELATEIQVRLQEYGFRTWMDIMDVGTNYSQSILSAIQHACVMICILSGGYVESQTCRKECESALAFDGNNNVPLLFVHGTKAKLSSEELQQGWIAPVLSGSVPIDTEDFEQAWEEIGTALEEVDQEEEEENGDTGVEEEIEELATSQEGDMFKLLIEMLGELKRENGQLKDQMQQLQDANKEIVAKMEALQQQVDSLQ